jgi:hypothetical protein
MRTTLDIEDDVLQAAKELAKQEGTTAGQVISSLARKALSTPSPKKITMRNGVPVFPATGEIITAEKIKQIMEAEGI